MNIKSIRITETEGSPYQPRHLIPQAEINELAASITESGLLAPILVRPVKKGNIRYQIVAGHRRMAACKVLGYDAIDAIVRPMSDLEAALASGTENIQRSELTGYEEYAWLLNVARLYEQEHEQLPSQATLAKLAGKHINWVRSRLQIAEYKPDVAALVKKHKNIISSSALINKISNKDQRAELIQMVDKGASFNDVKTAIDSANARAAITSAKAPDVETRRAITTGTASISKGKAVTGATSNEATREAKEQLQHAAALLVSAETWFDRIPPAAIKKDIFPILQSIIAKAEKLKAGITS